MADDTSLCSEENQKITTEYYPSVVERYFTSGYQVNLPKCWKKGTDEPSEANFNDVRILRHSNKICIVTIAPSHPLIKQAETYKVTGISLKVTEKLDRSQNQVHGKRKRGAHWLNPSSPLCIISCEDGSRHTVYCGIRGSLIEINPRLLNDPSLLQKSYETNGYIAIVMPKLIEGNQIMDSLLNEEEYQSYLRSCSKQTINFGIAADIPS
ncbi:protein Abitram-like [Clavelina lepadiformis]|uniref:Protein Simiate n=1 Tax=Clavelina lepadiformis TaxID=159417 RepID=A0ABP0GKE1_CLALP